MGSPHGDPEATESEQVSGIVVPNGSNALLVPHHGQAVADFARRSRSTVVQSSVHASGARFVESPDCNASANTRTGSIHREPPRPSLPSSTAVRTSANRNFPRVSISTSRRQVRRLRPNTAGPLRRDRSSKTQGAGLTLSSGVKSARDSHDRQYPHKCHRCDKTFRVWKNCQKHIQERCEPTKFHRCPDDPKTHLRRYAADEYHEKHHLPEDQKACSGPIAHQHFAHHALGCSICRRTFFRNPRAFIEHWREHQVSRHRGARLPNSDTTRLLSLFDQRAGEDALSVGEAALLHELGDENALRAFAAWCLEDEQTAFIAQQLNAGDSGILAVLEGRPSETDADAHLACAVQCLRCLVQRHRERRLATQSDEPLVRSEVDANDQREARPQSSFHLEEQAPHWPPTNYPYGFDADSDQPWDPLHWPQHQTEPAFDHWTVGAIPPGNDGLEHFPQELEDAFRMQEHTSLFSDLNNQAINTAWPDGSTENPNFSNLWPLSEGSQMGEQINSNALQHADYAAGQHREQNANSLAANGRSLGYIQHLDNDTAVRWDIPDEFTTTGTGVQVDWVGNMAWDPSGPSLDGTGAQFHSVNDGFDGPHNEFQQPASRAFGAEWIGLDHLSERLTESWEILDGTTTIDPNPATARPWVAEEEEDLYGATP